MSSRRMIFTGLAFCVVAAAALPAYPRTGPVPTGPGLVRVDIGGDWQFRQIGREEWHKAMVPGCVHTDLMAAGLIPDPFDRDNELKVQWVDKEDWEYRKIFEVDPTILKRESVELVCLGLDTFARLTLNGKPVGGSDNMFRAYRFDVRSLLVPGRNELSIVFESPVKREAALEAKLPYKIPGNAPHVRKAPYHFGWDWGPRLVTSGIWRPILLEAWDKARLNDLEVVQEFGAKGDVVLRVKAGILARAAGKAGLKVSVVGPGGERLVKARSLPVASGESSGDVVFKIAKPKLWWPNGMGPQNLYAVRAELSSGKDVLDAGVRRIGLRTLILEQKPDAWGKNFAFVVNGIPFFAKGGNWIPADSFPSRVTWAKYERLLKDCAAVNMNMLRVWGGGIYENPEFYDLCDELGLLVWQDFMFAGQMVPGDQPSGTMSGPRPGRSSGPCGTILRSPCGAATTNAKKAGSSGVGRNSSRRSSGTIIRRSLPASWPRPWRSTIPAGPTGRARRIPRRTATRAPTFPATCITGGSGTARSRSRNTARSSTGSSASSGSSPSPCSRRSRRSRSRRIGTWRRP